MAVSWTKAAKMAKYSAIGAEFVSPIIVGPVVGHILDQRFGTDPKLTLLMFFLGVLTGGYNLVREVRNFQRDLKQ
jgi:F0F1-type ATP synthase assembly protein I